VLFDLKSEWAAEASSSRQYDSQADDALSTRVSGSARWGKTILNKDESHPVALQCFEAIRDPQLEWMVRRSGSAADGTAAVTTSGSFPCNDEESGSRGGGGVGSTSSTFPELCVAVAGYVVQKRKASRKLLFLDIIEGPSRTSACLELLVKVPNLKVRRSRANTNTTTTFIIPPHPHADDDGDVGEGDGGDGDDDNIDDDGDGGS